PRRSSDLSAPSQEVYRLHGFTVTKTQFYIVGQIISQVERWQNVGITAISNFIARIVVGAGVRHRITRQVLHNNKIRFDNFHPEVTAEITRGKIDLGKIIKLFKRNVVALSWLNKFGLRTKCFFLISQRIVEAARIGNPHTWKT